MSKPEDARQNRPIPRNTDESSAPGKYAENGLPAGFEDLQLDGISRRRFLSLLSASAALAMGASCSKIDRGSIVPYTKNPDGILPGVAAYYASTFQEGWNTQGVLVKTREGRPIHISGNPDHPVSRGTVSLRAMGDLLGLYDPDRLRAPSFQGDPSTWDQAIAAMTRALENARSEDKSVLLMTGAVISPSQRALINELKQAVAGLQHVSWEPVSHQSQINPVIPKLHLQRAEVILSLQSDFLGNEANVYTSIHDFATRRRATRYPEPPLPPMNRLWIFEGPMTLTGANADERIRVKPSRIAPLSFALIRLLNEDHGIPLPAGLDSEALISFNPERIVEGSGVNPGKLKLLASNLAQARKRSLILAGPSLPADAHVACDLLNKMLEAEGNTLDSDTGIRISETLSNAELQDLLKEAADGKLAAAIFWHANPSYACPKTSLWKEAIANIPESFRIGLYEDETALDCNWRLPEHHWLESWGDFESSADYVSLRQPTIGPIHDTRQGEDILLSCMRKMRTPVSDNYLEYMKARWRSQVYPEGSPVDFETYWNAALHDGGIKCSLDPDFLGTPKDPMPAGAIASAGDAMNADNGMELVLLPGAGVYDGRYANNGWLNELPDPVTKATWENPVSLSIPDADRLKLQNGDLVIISNGEASIDAPVLIQPGQCTGVASIALGYGRKTGNVAAGIGSNAYSLMQASSSPFLVKQVEILRGKGPLKRTIPITQTHDLMEGRDLVRFMTLSEFEMGEHHSEKEHDPHHTASLIPEREYPEHKWSMAVDLSACVGCSACVIACQSENNIPVVGPERILRGRHMHWLRIDRYYEGDLNDPTVLHQPMFCQHCDDAPCEIVCPVNATTHSPDGLNQMAYNRCVGTRYCANNCPFKVRRFNFFDYSSMKKEPESLVFNPEVTVRPRGVMEKCTFCVQRIQDAKQKAKVAGRSIKDGDIVPACAAACPAAAIIFGDLNDPDSRVSKLSKSNRAYHMLEELGIKPSVTYLADISNPPEGSTEEPMDDPEEEVEA